MRCKTTDCNGKHPALCSCHLPWHTCYATAVLRYDICPSCSGHGTDGDGEDLVVCGLCFGSGKYAWILFGSPGFIDMISSQALNEMAAKMDVEMISGARLASGDGLPPLLAVKDFMPFGHESTWSIVHSPIGVKPPFSP